eukprot:CAMPEP_0184335632 /NCGR_PEP_ID=MMETSP1089-20130417/4172_1 /TAXON_ID=38269 ORGANISM="Gloeochaete wittrockiana, Strain SAG46.84" /NCGR_SAMPLE_ID=MMETSP1089 /ASSEMBLY_ACC=CAM_ASM_000445 /LENGTH=159 /DNA_ID=CAMNT_0026660401 /DNA_START=41 /DNA_END=517 /DNA_ORIENTATION=+
MADIDSLIRDIEGVEGVSKHSPKTASFRSEAAPASKAPVLQVPVQQKKSPPSKRVSSVDIDDLNDLLEDLDKLGKSALPPLLESPARENIGIHVASVRENNVTGRKSVELESNSFSGSSQAKRRCTQPCIGGTDVPVGMTSSLIDRKICSSLRCVKCDW